MKFKLIACLAASLIIPFSCSKPEGQETPSEKQEQTDEPGKPETPETPETPDTPDTPDEPQPPVEDEVKADLLDIVFAPDGTASDVSAHHASVQNFPGAPMVVYHNDFYDSYVAHFNHAVSGSIASGYVKVDYTNDKTFADGLADGHSIEVLCRLDETPDGSVEIKMFSSMQSGGTGFLVSKTAHGNCLTFLPNVSSSTKSNWIWCTSGVTPKAGQYYHLVGVWDKQKGEARIYVNGELKNTVPAAGNYIAPTSGATWFCVGGDPSNATACNTAWRGDVAIARVFNDPLDENSVKTLYEASKGVPSSDSFFDIRGISFAGKAKMGAGNKYNVYGTGFKSGDKVRFEQCKDKGTVVECETSVAGDHISATVPSTLVSGLYNVMACRGSAVYPLGTVDVTIGEGALAGSARCIAHRGYYKTPNTAENSIEALSKAQQLGVWGSEFDVWITTDDVIVVNHDSTFPTDAQARKIQECTFAQLSDIKLSNGESIPTFEDFLVQGAKVPGVKLVCEVKSHSSSALSCECVEKCIEMVKARNMEDQMVWIAFDYNVCKRVRALLPKANVQYLNGDKAPSLLAADGISGLDYKTTVMNEHNDWFDAAHKLGLEVNVWTVDSETSMQGYIDDGADYITTNYPEKLLELLKHAYIEK